MFIWSEVEDKVRVDPADLGKPVAEAVTAVIETNYIDKVGTLSVLHITEWSCICSCVLSNGPQ